MKIKIPIVNSRWTDICLLCLMDSMKAWWIRTSKPDAHSGFVLMSHLLFGVCLSQVYRRGWKATFPFDFLLTDIAVTERSFECLSVVLVVKFLLTAPEILFWGAGINCFFSISLMRWKDILLSFSFCSFMALIGCVYDILYCWSLSCVCLWYHHVSLFKKVISWLSVF